MNVVGFCPVVSGVLSSGVLSVWGFVLWGFVRTPVDTEQANPVLGKQLKWTKCVPKANALPEMYCL